MTPPSQTIFKWERWPEIMRVRHGRNAVVDALLQCPCKAAVLRGEPSLGPCGCMGPPDSIERVVRAEDVEELLRIQRERLVQGVRAKAEEIEAHDRTVAQVYHNAADFIERVFE